MRNPLMVLSRGGRLAWLGLVLLYLATQAGRQLGVVHGAVDWHLTDLLCLPVVLGLALIVQRLAGQGMRWRLPRWHGLVGVVGFAWYFEVVLPRFAQQATADFGDSLCYMLGWILFELAINRPLAVRRKVRDSYEVLVC